MKLVDPSKGLGDIGGGNILTYSEEGTRMADDQFKENCRLLCDASPECNGAVLDMNKKICYLKTKEQIVGAPDISKQGMFFFRM